MGTPERPQCRVTSDLSRFERKEKAEESHPLPDCSDSARPANLLISGEQGNIFDQGSCSDDAVHWILRIICGQLERLHRNIRGDRKHGETAFDFRQNGFYVGNQRYSSATCQQGNFKKSDARDGQAAVVARVLNRSLRLCRYPTVILSEPDDYVGVEQDQ